MNRGPNAAGFPNSTTAMKHKPLLSIFTALICSALPSLLFCQPPDLQFEHITTYNGLSQDIVTHIFRDRIGFLWFGTEDGLNRYDGYTIKTYKYDPGVAGSLSGRLITGISDYGDDGLLVTTEHGLDVYDRAHDVFVRPSGALASLTSASCTLPTRDRSGRNWVVVNGGTLLRYKPDSDRLDSLNPLYRSRSRLIHSLFFDHTDSLWIAGDSSIAVYLGDGRGFRHYEVSDPAGRGTIVPICITEDDNGILWIGTNAGLYQFERTTRVWKHVPLRVNGVESSFSRDLIGTLQWDRRRRLWIGSFTGLSCFNPETRTTVRYPHNAGDKTTILNDRIYSLYIDPSEILWVGTWRGGLNKTDFKKGRFGYVRHTPATPFAGGRTDVSTIYEDVSGNTWISCGDDANVTRINFSRNEYKHFSHDSRDNRSLAPGAITCITGDSTGTVWLAGSSILNTFNPLKGFFSHTNVLPRARAAGSILTISLDRRGYLWIGTDDLGAIRYDPRSGKTISFGPGSAATAYHRISGAWLFFEDRRGMLWMGGWGRNTDLHRLDPITGRLDSYHQPQLQSVRAIYEDSVGNLWAGTWGFGISRLNPVSGEIQQFTERNGLPNNFVKGILPDERGNLWISTERGLSRFSFQPQTFRNFDIHDGVQGNHFFSGSCCKGRGGRLYFGGENGFNAFHPDSIYDGDYDSPIVITTLSVGDSPRSLDSSLSLIHQIVLSSEENAFSFDFVSLDYSSPEQNLYSCKLEGLNKNWSTPGARRYASYTHLDPGSYQFSVKGTNSDGRWSSRIASAQITILPAFWQTWWFRSGAALLTLAILFGLFRYRLNKLLEIERTRSAIATDLHDDIGASLTSIALFSDLARNEISSNPIRATERLRRIAESSRTLLDKMNDIVWSISPENDSLEDMFLHMKDLAGGLLGARGIEYEFVIPSVIPDIDLPMSFRRNLFLIYKEVVHNIVKHSGSTKTEITVAFPHGQRKLHISIRDNGGGFDPDTTKRGHGLANIEKRARLLRAQVDYTSTPGAGSTVSINVPLKSPV